MSEIENISIVVIACNEQFGIRKCLDSILQLKMKNCEVICIDSGSEDATVSIMKEYVNRIPNLKIISISGYSNAAIARNVGIKVAKKKYIYFVDGDVEVFEDFLKHGIGFLNNEVDCLTGRLKEYRYNEQYTSVIKVIEDRFRIKKCEKMYASGGCFLIKREVINTVGFFDERLERSQDFDYTLRVTRKHTMIGIPSHMGIHHTIYYDSPSRLWIHIKNLHPVFLGMVISRNIKHFRGIAWLMLKRERGIFFGCLYVFSFLLLFFFQGTKILLPYSLIMFLDMMHAKLKKQKLPYRFYLHYMAGVLTLLGLIWKIDRRKSYRVIRVA